MEKDVVDERQDQVQEKSEPLSLRDTIRASIAEQKEKEADDGDKPLFRAEDSQDAISDKAEKESDKKAEKKEPDKKLEAKELDTKQLKDKEPKQLELDLGDKDKKVDDKQPKEAKSKAPFGLTKEIRAEWEQVPAKTQELVGKLLKENNEFRSDQGRNTYLRDVDAVLNPYKPEIQRLGVSPAQVVKRLLEYSDALASQQHKYAAIARLADAYGIDLTLFSKDKDQSNNNQQQQQGQNEPQYLDVPPELDNKLNTIMSRFDSMENTQKSVNDNAAKRYVNDWAGLDPATGEFTKKPYFPHVRQAMQQLIANGTIPIEDGMVDLDAAYETACFLNPQIRELVVEEQNKVNAQAEEQRRKQQTQQAGKARLAGSSIRSGAPLPVKPDSVTRDKTNRNMSVRDSIRQAISEIRN